MIHFVPWPLLLGLATLVALLTILRKRNFDSAYLLFFSAFWLYILSALSVTLFPIPLPARVGASPTSQGTAFILSHVNFVPFSYIGFFNAQVILQEIGRNILLTLPFGFGIGFIAEIRRKDLLWLAPTVGLTTEGIQLAASLASGGLYRTVDVTDVLLNAVRVWLGYGYFRVFSRLYLARTEHSMLKPGSVLAYVRNVAARAQPEGGKSG